MSRWIYGRNAVLEALRAGTRPVRRLVVAAGSGDARLRAILDAARRAGVPVARETSQAIRKLAGGESGHQGIVAEVAGASYADPAAVVAAASARPLFVVLDGIEDPRNLGAVIRTAAAAGADGLFIPERRCAGLTAVAVKAAAGAAERLPVARISNVTEFLKQLKKNGIWVVGLDSDGDRCWSDFDLTPPTALVLGGEGKGLRRLARETCDVVVAVPLGRGVESLNLSVAAGIVLFEAVRQRRAVGEKIF